ncbi:hypothetical protein WR164_01930 [Philodulcilactobacillus myokoensis]|uniref:Uncharacterized protein n=1 Tax=Philodulcilactobacillus myokoensis TaxID=2929573 RepID=A0A9W6B145_9LACO|nr:hypothetical protein [Philodulcilactobacillus myokoensis]GLB46214.1 hypothetical protein WR164_01930 [Philodulcilactobacillus myokoensis]
MNKSYLKYLTLVLLAFGTLGGYVITNQNANAKHIVIIQGNKKVRKHVKRRHLNKKLNQRRLKLQLFKQFNSYMTTDNNNISYSCLLGPSNTLMSDDLDSVTLGTSSHDASKKMNTIYNILENMVKDQHTDYADFFNENAVRADKSTLKPTRRATKHLANMFVKYYSRKDKYNVNKTLKAVQHSGVHGLNKKCYYFLQSLAKGFKDTWHTSEY